MPLSLRTRVALALAALLLSSSCGGGDADEAPADAETVAEDAGSNESPAPSSSDAPAPSQNTNTAPITAADVEHWETGMAGEMKAVQEVAATMKSARSNEDTMSAMMGVQETSTMAAGAGAAGIDLERYKFIRSNLSAAVKALTPGLGGIDTTMLAPAQRAELRQMTENELQRLQQDVPKEVIDGLRPRAVELRKKELELVGARLKGAGLVR